MDRCIGRMNGLGYDFTSWIWVPEEELDNCHALGKCGVMFEKNLKTLLPAHTMGRWKKVTVTTTR